MHTLNIALNDDFEGGSLFYIKPPADQEGEAEDDRPDIPEQYKNYDWINSLKRKNTSDIIFPTLQTGDVLIYNFTLWHAVAPLEVGTRYSFVLFYDMDNPAIQGDFDHLGNFPVSFYHEIEDMKIDLVFVDETDEGETYFDMIEDNMQPFEEVTMDTYDDHVFLALISGTDTVVSEFVMRSGGTRRYTIVKKEVLNDEL
mmetsp:Transcript_3406/g.8660  ORF Transcript_3406/g.8660 Transcript_3406/m.8660 type:complete len:199 (+) Transcript_3406:597-1193(+)